MSDSIQDSYQDGHESYYDDILRYKNPYSGLESESWFRGWDEAEEYHRLFTDNQTFRDQIKELKEEIKELEDSVSGFKKSMIQINTNILSSIDHIRKSKFLYFHREKLVSKLKNINLPECEKS
jgi:uncharacterized coiled-coil DUF342 family protein